MNELLKQLTTKPTFEHTIWIILLISICISMLSFISKLEDAEKILAAEFYTLYAKKCKNNMMMETLAFKLTTEKYEKYKEINKQYKEEFQTMTKQFLEETPREFLRLNNFKVVKQ